MDATTGKELRQRDQHSATAAQRHRNFGKKRDELILRKGRLLRHKRCYGSMELRITQVQVPACDVDVDVTANRVRKLTLSALRVRGVPTAANAARTLPLHPRRCSLAV